MHNFWSANAYKYHSMGCVLVKYNFYSRKSIRSKICNTKRAVHERFTIKMFFRLDVMGKCIYAHDSHFIVFGRSWWPVSFTHICQAYFTALLKQPIMIWLTYWGRDKKVAILQTTLSNTFFWMEIFQIRLRFHWNLFLMVQNSSMGSNNGLAPNRRQAIIGTNDG